MGAAVLLAEAFAQDILNIIVPESLLEFLLSGGIDALADDHGLFPELHALGEGTDHCPVLADRRLERHLLYSLCGPADMLRRRAAASSHGLHAHPGDLFHPSRKLRGSHIVNGPAALCAGQAGIGVDDDRHAADLREPPDDGQHLLRSQAAVDAQGIYAESFEKRDGGIHGTAGQQFPFLVEGDRYAHGKIAVLLGCEHRRLGLIAVRHRLDQNEIRSRPAAAADHLSEQFHSSLKGKVPQGLKKFPCRSDIQRNIGVLPAAPAPRFFGQIYCRRYDLLQVFRIFERVCAKGIRVENIAAGAQVSAVQIDDILRPFEIPGLRKLSALQALLLQDRSRPAVKDQPFFSQSLKQFFFHRIFPLSEYIPYI